MSKPDLERPGVWARLFPRALKLMSHLEREVPSAHWTFGGGTVLMLRLSHRRSKDIDPACALRPSSHSTACECNGTCEFRRCRP